MNVEKNSACLAILINNKLNFIISKVIRITGLIVTWLWELWLFPEPAMGGVKPVLQSVVATLNTPCAWDGGIRGVGGGHCLREGLNHLGALLNYTLLVALPL